MGARAAIWACAALSAGAFTAQVGRAQAQSAGTADAETLAKPAGLLNGGSADELSPFAWDIVAPAPDALRGVWYSGYDAARGEQYAFSGATVALNGDIDRSGYHVRVYGSWVAYDLDPDPGNGRGYQGDLMIGYRIVQGNVDAGLYLGADYQNYRLDSDDPTIGLRGTEWGFKMAADVEAIRKQASTYFALAGEYSTAFQTYWARMRVGPYLHGVAFGAEAAAIGDVDSDAQRLGAFVVFDVNPFPQMAPLGVALHAGHQFVADDDDGGGGGIAGGKGAYGGITFNWLF